MGDNIIVHVDTKKISFAGDRLSIPPVSANTQLKFHLVKSKKMVFFNEWAEYRDSIV